MARKKNVVEETGQMDPVAFIKAVKGIVAEKEISEDVVFEAMELALEEKVEIKHSKAYLTPYFNYKKNNVNHVVHFDDALSYKEKIELAIKENIGGISIWTLSSSNVTLTKLIDNYFEIRNF